MEETDDNKIRPQLPLDIEEFIVAEDEISASELSHLGHNFIILFVQQWRDKSLKNPYDLETWAVVSPHLWVVGYINGWH